MLPLCCEPHGKATKNYGALIPFQGELIEKPQPGPTASTTITQEDGLHHPQL